MCLFLTYFGLFWQFVDADVVFHKQFVCAYHAVVRFVVLFLVAQFRVLDAKFFLGCYIVVGLFVVYFAFLVVEFFF
jgi:hypothetical protein